MSRTGFPLRIKLLPAALTAALAMLGSATVANAQYYDQGSATNLSATQYQSARTDPSSRVARLAYMSGDVELAPAGVNDFGRADINRPLTTGDRLLTGDDGRAALELGGAALRIDHGSAFNFLNLDDNTAQVELSQGTLNLRVRTLDNGQTYEIDTPTVAFVASQPGMYRVDVALDGNGAMVTVFDGAGTVYGENGVSRQVAAGQSYRFNDSGLTDVEVSALPAPDDFDLWAQARDNRWRNSVSRRYVSEDVVGFDDLDQYGDWEPTPDYGNVWFPTQVSVGWVPYREGHWVWIDPWGWTWVDDEPWGFAPFHYGRWVYVLDRWGWCPGPREYRPVYAPALVAFVGGSGFSLSINIGGGQPVGWFPLGPRDVYVPWYQASRNYFTNVNVTNIRNVYVNKTVINNYYGDYAANRPLPANYAYRSDPRAFTAVPRDVFAGARPVRDAVLHVQPAALARAQIVPPRIAPTAASLAVRPSARPIAAPVARAFDRTVIALHAPPPKPVPFATRERLIAQRGGAPIPVAQLHQMRERQANAQPERVQVVAGAAHAAAPLPPMKRVPELTPKALEHPPAAENPTRAPQKALGRYPPGQVHISPIQAPVHPSNDATSAALREAPLRPGELPSARFAHPVRNANPLPPAGPERNEQLRAQQAQQWAQAEQQQAQMHDEQARRRAIQPQQLQQQAEQARVQQQQAQQRETEARQRNDEMRAQQEQQRAEQMRAQQAQMEQQRAEQMRAQQAQMEQQRAEQMRAQQAQMEQQRAEQMRAQQAQMEQQRAEQMRAQQAQMEQQRAEQMRAQQAQMEQQRAEQMRAAQQQREQYAPPTRQAPQPPPKKRGQDNQDNGH